MSDPATTVIFDLDGTLVHSSPDIAAALNATLAGFGRQVSLAEVERMIGDGLGALLSRALAHTQIELRPAAERAALSRLRAYYRASPATLSSVHEWVANVMIAWHRDGGRVAICSNKDEDLVLDILRALDLSEWVHGVAGFRSGEQKKPDPAPLLRAVAQAGGNPDNAVMVGDSRADVEAARAARMPVVVVPHGYGRDHASQLGADRIVSDAAELRAAILDLTSSASRSQ